MINIQEYQTKKKEQEIVDRELKNGNIVTSFDVLTKLNQFFQYKTAGLPYYKNLRIKPYSKSDKEVWNKSFKELEEDLNVAYTIYNNQEKAILGAKGSFDSEVLELYKEFDELSSEVELATEFSNKGEVYHPYIISFNSLQDVNCKNLYNHNIPYTTCEIDYDKSILRNELHSTPGDKIDLSKAKILVTSPSKNVNLSKDIQCIVSENSTDILTVETRSNSDSPQSLHIDVFLDRPHELSKINLSCFNITNAKVVLLISENDNDYIEKEIKNGQKDLEWVFNRRKVKRFKFIIQKMYNDISGDLTHASIFSIVNISAYNDKYNKSGVFTSEIVRFDEPITDVMLIPSHEMPPKTDISYFIGYEDSNDDIEWYPIKPNERMDLNLLYREESILNYITETENGGGVFGRPVDRDERDQSKKMFYIHEIPKYTNLNSIELRAGHSQWLIERLDMTPKYGQLYPKDEKVNISDYSKEYITAIAPLDMSMTEIRCQKKWNYFVLSSYIICDKETIVEDRYMNYPFSKDADGKNVETLDLAVLVNGRRIFPKGNKYSFRFKKGENQIKIMVLFGNQDVSDIENLKTITHNFNLLGVGSGVFAGPKMKRMNYNSVYKYISNKELKHYAIKTVDRTDYIVTKLDPNYIINPWDPYTVKSSRRKRSVVSYDPPQTYVNTSEYMRMYVSYKHMLPSTLEKITNKKKDSSVRCRVMARLTSSDISVSPTINKIKVVGV